MFWKLLLTACLLLRNCGNCYIEYVHVSNCESCPLMLTCRHLSAVIAVFNATFQPFDSNSTYVEDVREMRLFPRFALNRRCSGVNHCSFVLTEDCPGADRWGPGNVSVKFACITDRRISQYCNDNITLPNPEVIGISEGLIRNPGYPKFYIGKEACTWRIRAPPMQRIKLTILDVALISTNIDPEECSDVLEVTEIGTIVFSSCTEQEPYSEVYSLRDSLDVTLKVSEDVVARRGVLLHYTAVGCTTPQSPIDGYLVYRNDTYAMFTCCIGYAFSDSKCRNRELHCLGHRWDQMLPLPKCTKVPTDTFTSSRNNFTLTGIMLEESFADVLVPTVIIIILFLINSIVLFFIYKYKKRKIAQYSEEELGTMAVGSGN